jgi:hypothetical protein
MKTAEIEHVTYAVAHCPYCENETHDVDSNDSGEIKCECGETFHWSTEY